MPIFSKWFRFPTKSSCTFLFFLICATCSWYIILLDLINLIICSERYKAWCQLCYFVQPPVTSCLFLNTFSPWSFLNMKDKSSHLCKTQAKISAVYFNACVMIENRNTSRLIGVQHCPVLVYSCFLHACKYLQNAEYLIHSWSVTLKSTILSATYGVSFHRRMLGKILYAVVRRDLPWSPLLWIGISVVYSFHCWGNSSLSQK